MNYQNALGRAISHPSHSICLHIHHTYTYISRKRHKTLRNDKEIHTQHTRISTMYHIIQYTYSCSMPSFLAHQYLCSAFAFGSSFTLLMGMFIIRYIFLDSFSFSLQESLRFCVSFRSFR